MAYNLMERVEEHAFHTYDSFLKSHGEELKTKPAPEVAIRYYTVANPYLFDEFQIGVPPGERRPVIETLYDVFVAIRDDEGLHADTMRLCQRAGAVRSPHEGADDASAAACEGVVECVATTPTGFVPIKTDADKTA
jgi:ubiquinol oxidase